MYVVLTFLTPVVSLKAVTLIRYQDQQRVSQHSLSVVLVNVKRELRTLARYQTRELPGQTHSLLDHVGVKSSRIILLVFPVSPCGGDDVLRVFCKLILVLERVGLWVQAGAAGIPPLFRTPIGSA